MRGKLHVKMQGRPPPLPHPGPWPDLPNHPPDLSALASDASIKEQNDTLRTALIAFSHYWSRAVQALEYLRKWTEAHELLHTMGGPRGQLMSVHSLAKEVASDVAVAYREEIRNPTTPPVPEPDAIQRLVEDRVQQVLLQMKAAEFDKIQRANAAALEEKKERDKIEGRYRIQAKWSTFLALITVLALLAEKIIKR
jgi:hypothetical protein